MPSDKNPRNAGAEKAYDFSTDVAIIGAGPAGSATSLFLSKAGIRHTIFDLAIFPRDKVCGDALSGKAVSILKKLDPEIAVELAKTANEFLGSWGVSFIAPNGRRIDVPFRKGATEVKDAPGFLARRIDFDNFLVRHFDPAVTKTLFGAKVTDVKCTADGVEIEYQQNGHPGRCLAQMVIGAEGNRSIVAKKLAGHKADPKHYCSAIRAYYENVSGMHPKNFIELYFLPEVLPGYLWVFPLPNNMANVGVGVLSAKVKKSNINLKLALEKAITENPHLKDRFKDARLTGGIQGWGLPLGSKKRNLSGDRFLLVGDAASLIDPFSGEGIGNALVSGMFAAETAGKAVKEKDFSAKLLSAYDQAVYQRLWSEFKLSYNLQRLGGFQWLFNLVVNKAHRNPTFRDTISCMFDDMNLRARLSSPSFYFRLLFN